MSLSDFVFVMRSLGVLFVMRLRIWGSHFVFLGNGPGVLIAISDFWRLWYVYLLTWLDCFASLLVSLVNGLEWSVAYIMTTIIVVLCKFIDKSSLH